MTGTFKTLVRITKEAPDASETSAVAVKMIDHRLGTKARIRLVQKVASDFQAEAHHGPSNPAPKPNIAPSIQLDAYEQAMKSFRRDLDRITKAISVLEPLRAEIMFGADTRAAFLKEVVEGKHLRDTSEGSPSANSGRPA